MHSFNAGITAIRPPEDVYYLEQILRRPHRRLRWVFLEMMELNSRNDATLAATVRSSYWHDWKRTGLLTERCFVEGSAAFCAARTRAVPWSEALLTGAQSLGVWLDNLGLFVENFSGCGRGEPLLSRCFHPSKKRTDGSRLGLAWDGWAFPQIAKPWTKDPKRSTAYERSYEELLAAEQRFDPGDAVSWKALNTKLAQIAQAGATPILIIPPTLSPKRYFAPELAGTSLAVLDFSDPRKHPELFTLDHRLDGHHLNYDGSVIFTGKIALAFIETLRDAGKIP